MNMDSSSSHTRENGEYITSVGSLVGLMDEEALWCVRFYYFNEIRRNAINREEVGSGKPGVCREVALKGGRMSWLEKYSRIAKHTEAP